MSGAGAPSIEVNGEGLSVAVVASSWHETVMDGLVAGATRALTAAGADFEVFRVPGAFELPIVVQACAEAEYDAVVALGVVIRGGTPHFEYVCRATTDGLAHIALDLGVPIGFGLLTCDDEAQALDRAGLEGSSEDKGAEAANAAIATAALLQEIHEDNE